MTKSINKIYFVNKKKSIHSIHIYNYTSKTSTEYFDYYLGLNILK